MTFLEYTMSAQHKARIAASRSHTTQTPETKRKIAKAMAGKKNHAGKKHSESAKKKIADTRGDRDPIQGRHWIVDVKGKTYRRYSTPIGYKPHKRTYRD